MRTGFSYEELYVEALTTIKRDIENLLDCELPAINETPETQISKLCIEIRKKMGETSKKLRGKITVQKPKDSYECTIEEF